jgi:rubrerythrin
MAVKTDPRIELLRQMYAAIAEAIEALRDHEKLKDTADRLRKTVKSQEEKIDELRLQLSTLERLTEKRVKICPVCNGAGAYMHDGHPEECLKCDGVGAIEA